MKITINNKMYQLRKKDVIAAKKVTADFIANAREISKGKSERFYLTLLLVMHSMSQSLINEIDPESMGRILEELKEKE